MRRAKTEKARSASSQIPAWIRLLSSVSTQLSLNSPSAAYPVLHRLERQGFVAAKWAAAESGRRRKYYRITKKGRAQLAAQRQQWQAVDNTLRGIWMKACTV